MATNPYRQILQDSVPHDFVRESLRLLINTYRATWDTLGRKYPYEEAHDLFPHELRASFERDWRELAGKHPRVYGSVERNKTGGAFHTEVYSGPIVLTQCALDTPRQFSRLKKAIFRQTLAQDFQLNLLEPREDKAPWEKLYGVLVHGPAQAKSPGFACIGFPDPDCTKFLGLINLFSYCPEMLKLYEASEEKPQELDIRLKPSGRRKRRKPSSETGS